MLPLQLPLLETFEAEALPPLYDRWIRSFLPRGIPRESRADCSNCPQVADSSEAAPSLHPRFAAETKCCTYLPELPNFCVGGILSDGLEGAASVRQRMSLSPGCVSPIGLLRTELYQAIYYATRERAFGRAPLLLCPHYVSAGTGTCSIWRHRNSVCSSWFCLHTRSWLGHAFWVAMKDLLGEVERQVSAWCAQGILGVGWCMADMARQSKRTGSGLADEVIGRVPLPDEERMWNGWGAKKEEYFVECATRVSALTWESVVDLIGAVGRNRIEVTLTEYEKMLDGGVPQRVRVGKLSLTQLRNGSRICLSGPGTLEEVDLSTTTVECLAKFDGRDTEVVLATLPQKARRELTPAILLKLLEVGALVEGPTTVGDSDRYPTKRSANRK